MLLWEAGLGFFKGRLGKTVLTPNPKPGLGLKARDSVFRGFAGLTSSKVPLFPQALPPEQ